MEQLLFNERVSISSSASRRQPHLRFLNNGRGKNKPAKVPGKRRVKAKTNNQEAVSGNPAPAAAGPAPGLSATVCESGTEPGLEFIMDDVMAPGDQHLQGQTWNERQEMEAEHWEEVRGTFYDDAVSACAVPNHGSVRQNRLTSSATTEEIKVAVSRWLQGTRDRDGRRLQRLAENRLLAAGTPPTRQHCVVEDEIG